MEDTWQSIGLFQPFDGGISGPQAQADAPRYVLTWGTDKPGTWVAGNGRINATYYLPFDTDADIGDFGDLGHSLDWWQNVGPHPDWVLYKCDRTTPAWVGGLPQNVPLDISNPDVVAYQMSTIAPYMLMQGYTSLAADVLSLQNGQSGCGVWAHGHTVWVQRFSGKAVDPRWAAAAQSWAAYTQWYMHGMPVPMPFVANGPLNAAPHDPSAERLMAHVDGYQDEAGFTSFGNHMISDAGFRTKVWWAQYIQAQGKAFMVTDLWQGQEPDPVQRDFAIATYLMGRYHQAAMMTAKYGSYGYEHYWPEYASPVGSPCADMYPDQGV